MKASYRLDDCRWQQHILGVFRLIPYQVLHAHYGSIHLDSVTFHKPDISLGLINKPLNQLYEQLAQVHVFGLISRLSIAKWLAIKAKYLAFIINVKMNQI